MRILLPLLVILVIVLWFMRGKVRARSRSDAGHRHAGQNRAEGEVMIPCTLCGTHIPTSEAVSSASGDAFCCEKHRVAHERT